MAAVPPEIDSHQIVLVVDDDAAITDALAMGLEREGRTVITCRDIESAELAVEAHKPSHVVCDIRLSGQYGFEGLHFILFVKRQSPDTRVILMTGDGPHALQLEASQRGATGFLCKPFELDELNELLNSDAPYRRGGSEEPAVIHVPTLEEVLTGGLVSTLFQPIVRLATGEHAGYEALTRCQSDSLLQNPEALFRYAARQLRVADLEITCVGKSLQSAAALPDGAAVFINVHPSALTSDHRLCEVIIAEAAKSGIALDRIVLEITEQSPLSSDPQIVETIFELKRAGIRFAFDDVGIAYSHLPLIDQIKPAFLKISRDFGTGFESDEVKSKIVRNIMALAADFGCELILEGIETHETAEAARGLGIALGQGYHYARPAPAGAAAN
ncbi:MAG TPA: EAL domain-containing protein [Thermoanaerobaculia bacterium]